MTRRGAELLGRYRDAGRLCQQAAALFRAAGSDAAFASYGLTCLGVALLGDERAADAVPPLIEALRIRSAASLPPAQVGETRFALARALGRPRRRSPVAPRGAWHDEYAGAAGEADKGRAIDA